MKFRQALFWDTDPKKIDPKKNARYIIERVLEFGRPNETGWVFKNYSQKVIKKNLISSTSAIKSQIKSIVVIVYKMKKDINIDNFYFNALPKATLRALEKISDLKFLSRNG